MIDSRSQLATRYGSFFMGGAYATIGFATVELIGAWVYSSAALAATALTTGLLGLSFVVGRLLLLRQRLFQALITTSAGGSLAALLYMVSLPELVASFTLFPLCVIGLAMLVPSRKLFLGASIAAVLVILCVIALSFMPRLLPPAPPELLLPLSFMTPAVVVSLLALLFGYTWNNSNASLLVSQRANQELARLRDGLELEVEQRTSELKAALNQVQTQSQHQARLLEEIERQQNTIRELGAPVLPISSSTAVVPLVGALDSARLEVLRDRALSAVERLKVRTLLLDLTGVELLDEKNAAGILELSAATRMLGAATILIGIRPEVAQSLVALGIDLRDTRSMRDLQTALKQVEYAPAIVAGRDAAA